MEEKEMMITIEKGYYDFLMEKARERCELYSENNYLWRKLMEARNRIVALEDEIDELKGEEEENI